MPLVPVTQSVALVSKIALTDPDGATELARLAMYEAFYTLVDKHGERISADLDEQDERLRRQLVRSFVAKRARNEDVSGLLAAGDLLSKARSNYFDEKRHKRDPYTGRWIKVLGGKNAGDRLNAAGAVADEWQRTGLVKPGAPIYLRGTSEMNGWDSPRDVQHQIKDGQLTPTSDTHPVDFAPTHISIAPEDVDSDINRRQTHPRKAGARDLGQQFIGGPGGSPDKFGSNLRNVSEQRPGTDRRGYRQLSATGGAVRALSVPGTPSHTAGVVAQVAGELGPQAEAVLGSSIKRTAYKYRGTERKPDAQLLREVSQANQLAPAVGNPDHTDALETIGRTGGLAAGTAVHLHGKTFDSDEQRDLRLRGDTAVGYFARKIPTPERTALSIAAGRVPPSQGAIIGADGQVATEAMGYGSDHYLPFDLKNLKSLNGGQYVRTRAAGGPTTEDIYTGLLGGARQIQVVSNSGVFTVEFDPELRGGRRYSDKARQMIGRYSDLLETIDNGQQWAQDIAPARKAELRSQALDQAGGDAAAAKTNYDRALSEEREQLLFARPDDDELRIEAHEAAINQFRSKGERPSNQQLAQREEDLFHEQLREETADLPRRLQLDGEGYQKALLSLQEEFPYFIRDTKFEALRDFDQLRGHSQRGERPLKGSPRASDRGYVAPGSLTARAAKPVPSRQARAKTEAAPAESTSGGGGGASRPAPADAPKAATPGLRPFTPLAGAGEDDAAAEYKLKDNLAALQPLFQNGDLVDIDENIDPSSAEYASQLQRAKKIPLQFATMQMLHAGPATTTSNLLKKQTPDDVKSFIEGLEALKRKATSRQADYPQDISDGDIASIDSAITQLRQVQGKKAGLRQVEKPATYAPEDNTPAHFDEIAGLGSTPDNYENFLKAQSGTPFARAVEEQKGMSEDDRRQHVLGKVSAYTNASNYANATDARNKPGALPKGINNPRDAKQLVADGEKGQHYNDLLAHQQAWAFLHQRELIGGGAPGPKAPEPASAATTTKVEVPKRYSGPPRIPVYPRNSLVGKAFARARAKERSLG